MQESYLTVSLIDSTNARPITNAKVNIYTYDTSNGAELVYNNLPTNISGQVVRILLSAPDIGYSEEPSNVKPYSQYTVEAIAEGYETALIEGIQMFPLEESRQEIKMVPLNRNKRSSFLRQNDIISIIGEHTLWGSYPAKIPESDLKELPPPTGFVVLDNPVVPEYIVVHDGSPDDSTAPNYWVEYKEYIKNVASSEIYSTWPIETIYANVVAIISFTLNRVFTEWYRSKGYDFTITSSTAVDHKFIYNRNLFTSINVVVDDIFNTYIKRPPTSRQPLLSQYCDGQKVQCPNQMTQWGSKYLGDQGYSWQDILYYYYGDNLAFPEAAIVSGVPASYPGYTLQMGTSGQYVRTIQNQLNVIANTYSAIPKNQEDGIYGTNTFNATKKFQEIFGLPQTGIVDFKTWYEISRLYVAVTKIASLNPVI
ncbi:MAG: peptidoglycan-binding protein [Clostridioides sp.]|nr:peptidoglycan-binding protein [Clostridioides sp.]